MKSFKFLLAGMVAAVVTVGASATTTTVHICGSTAFRGSVVAGIIDTLITPSGAYLGTSGINGANQAVISGGLSNGDTIVYELAWSGSISGLTALTTSVTSLPGASFSASQTWLNASNGLTSVSVTTTNNAFTYVFTGGNVPGSPTYDSFTQPDVAMADCFIGSASATGALPTATISFTSIAASGLPSSVVGVIPFAWVKGPQGAGVSAAQYNRFTNMTVQLAKELFLTGTVPLSLFTGNSGDTAVDVVLTGRNIDSGTRFGALAEAGLAENTSITQYGFTISGGAIDSFGLGLTSGDDGDPYLTQDGQSSGGNVAGWVKLPPDANAENTEFNNQPFIVASYLGVSDAKTVATGNGSGTSGATLSWNGVPSYILLNGSLDIFNGTTNTLGGTAVTGQSEAGLIQTGQFSYWEYEHLYLTSALSGDGLTAVTLLHTKIVSVDALAAGMLGTTASGMQVARTNEFTPPF
jgi:hypothetical protein